MYASHKNDSIFHENSGVPYITIHAERKARAIWKLVHSIHLSEELFLDLDADAANDGANDNGDGVNNSEEGTTLTNKDRMGDEDDVDSEDEMDDVGEEEGAVEVVSLVS